MDIKLLDFCCSGDTWFAEIIRANYFGTADKVPFLSGSGLAEVEELKIRAWRWVFIMNSACLNLILVLFVFYLTWSNDVV
jgi:hypothetical protein